MLLPLDIPHLDVYKRQNQSPVDYFFVRKFAVNLRGCISNSRSSFHEEDYVIRGKAISSDRAGNVYKSLYI